MFQYCLCLKSNYHFHATRKYKYIELEQRVMNCVTVRVPAIIGHGVQSVVLKVQKTNVYKRI